MSEQYQSDSSPPATAPEPVDLYGSPAFRLLFGEGMSGWTPGVLKLPEGDLAIYQRVIDRKHFGHANPSRLFNNMAAIMKHFVDDQFNLGFQPVTGEIKAVFVREAFDRSISPHLGAMNSGSLACPPLYSLEAGKAAESDKTTTEITRARNAQILQAALAYEGPNGWHYDQFNECYYRDIPKQALRHIVPIEEEEIASTYVNPSLQRDGAMRVRIPREIFEKEYLPLLEGAPDSELGLNIVPVNFRDRSIGNEALPNLRHPEEAASTEPSPAPKITAAPPASEPPASPPPSATRHLDAALQALFGAGREGFKRISRTSAAGTDDFYERTIPIAQPGMEGDVFVRNMRGVLHATCGKAAREQLQMNDDCHAVSMRVRIPAALFHEKFYPAMSDHGMGTLRNSIAPDLAKGFTKRFQKSDWLRTMLEIELFGGGIEKWHPTSERPYREIPKLRRSGNIKQEFALLRSILDDVGLFGAEIRQSEDKPWTLQVRLLGDAHREPLQKFYDQRPELSGVISMYR